MSEPQRDRGCQRLAEPFGRECGRTIPKGMRNYCSPECQRLARASTGNWRQRKFRDDRVDWDAVFRSVRRTFGSDRSWLESFEGTVLHPSASAAADIQTLANELSARVIASEGNAYDFYEDELEGSVSALRLAGPHDPVARTGARRLAKAILRILDKYPSSSPWQPRLQIKCYRLLIAAGFEGPETEHALRELARYADRYVELCQSERDYAQLGHAYLDRAQVLRLFGQDGRAYQSVNLAYQCFREQCLVPRFRSRADDFQASLAKGLYEATQYKHRLQNTLARQLRRTPARASEIWVELSWVASVLSDKGSQAGLLQAHRELVAHYAAEVPTNRRALDAAYDHLATMKSLWATSEVPSGSLTYYHNTFVRVEVELLLAERTTRAKEAATELIVTDYLPHVSGHAHYWRQANTWHKILRDFSLPAPAIAYGSPALIFNL